MSRQSGQQWLLLAASLALWSVVGQPSLLALLFAYLAVWFSWQWRPVRRTLAALTVSQLVLLATLTALPAVAWGYRVRAEIVEREQWPGLLARSIDRWRLDATPAIAPALLSTDQPQTFYVHAPDAQRVRVQFSATVHELAAEELGAGLFRVSYDPRRDGLPQPNDGELSVRIAADGGEVQRAMKVVTPLVHPRWFCESPRGSWAATPSEETDELIVIDRVGQPKRISVGDGPVDCVFPDEQSVIVSERFAARLRVYELATGRVMRELSMPGRLGRMAIDGAASRLAVASEGSRSGSSDVSVVSIVRWPEFDVSERVPLTAAPDWVAFGRDAKQLIVSTRADAKLHLLSRRADRYEPTAMQSLGRPAVTLGRARDGGRVWIATTDYRPDGRPQLGNHFVQDQLLTFSTTDLALLDRRFTARRSERQSKPGDVDQGGSPMGIRELRDGSLAVCFAGTDELWRLRPGAVDPDVFDLSASELRAPHGVVELADSTLVLSSPANGALGVLRPGATSLRVVSLAPSDAVLQKQNPQAFARRLGERGFYESTRAGIACQSCHSHADSDASGYNLGDHRTIPTLSVRGLFGTAPYLRDASYPLLRDLDEVAQQRYRGYLRRQPGRGFFLEAFMEALPRPQPSAAKREPESERRGRSVFVKARCGRCHSLPAFTNLAQLPMATLFPKLAALLPPSEVLDVPSLLSVGSSAPYLNDGRAASLLAVFKDHNPDNLHGDTRQLSAAELRDLVAFLAAL